MFVCVCVCVCVSQACISHYVRPSSYREQAVGGASWRREKTTSVYVFVCGAGWERWARADASSLSLSRCCCGGHEGAPAKRRASRAKRSRNELNIFLSRPDSSSAASLSLIRSQRETRALVCLFGLVAVVVAQNTPECWPPLCSLVSSTNALAVAVARKGYLNPFLTTSST